MVCAVSDCMPKPIEGKVSHLRALGIGAKAIGDTLYLWFVPKPWTSETRYRVIVLHNNPTFRVIRKHVPSYFHRGT